MHVDLWVFWVLKWVFNLDQVTSAAMVKAADMEDFLHGSGECIPASRPDVGIGGGVKKVDVFFAKGVVDLEDYGGEGVRAVVEIVVGDWVEAKTQE